MNKLLLSLMIMFCGIHSLMGMESQNSKAIVEKYGLKDGRYYKVVKLTDNFDFNDFSVRYRRSNTINPNIRGVKNKFYPGRVLRKKIKENHT